MPLPEFNIGFPGLFLRSGVKEDPPIVLGLVLEDV
jgi:hypothetical protein